MAACAQAGVIRLGPHLLVSTGEQQLVAVCLHGKEDLSILESHALLLQHGVVWFELPDGQSDAYRELPPAPDTLNLLDLRVWAIRTALRITAGNRTHAAPLLGIKSAALRTYLLTYPDIEAGIAYDGQQEREVS